MLRNACPAGLIYTRSDEDVFTISTNRIVDGRKRRLNESYKIPMFRNVSCIALIDLNENIRLMAVEWRHGARERRAYVAP